MFCKKCQNFMDITNNVSLPTNIQSGGVDEDTSSDFDISSDMTTSKKKKNSITNITETDIENILNGHDISFELDNFSIEDINKISYFNKLTNNQKTLVINRLYEKVPSNQKIVKNTNIVVKESYFYCKNCGYNEKIPDKMFIFSRSFKSNNALNNNFLNYKYDNTLPFSKKYNCINQNCSTHKNPITKNAVFYRFNNTYTIRYICTICDSYWNTVNEQN